jgi:hypothetical protein
VPFCVAHQLIADMSLTTGSVVWEIGCGVVRFAAVISAVTGSVVYCSEVHDVYKYLMGIAETLRGAFPKSTYVPLCEALSKCPAAATADYDQRMVAGTFPANTSFVDELEKCFWVNVVVAVVSGKLNPCNTNEATANSEVTGRVSGRFHLAVRHRTKVTLIYKS